MEIGMIECAHTDQLVYMFRNRIRQIILYVLRGKQDTVRMVQDFRGDISAPGRLDGQVLIKNRGQIG